jgi:hypothetical protein
MTGDRSGDLVEGGVPMTSMRSAARGRPLSVHGAERCGVLEDNYGVRGRSSSDLLGFCTKQRLHFRRAEFPGSGKECRNYRRLA